MYITSREREIINLLLLHPNGITVSEIATKLSLSGRTIHRELKQVEAILSKHGINLEKRAGSGLFLHGTNEKYNELKVSLLKQSSDFTSKEREELILLTLLKSTDVTKLVALANDFNVTVGTISKDLDQVERYLKSFGIALIRKKGHGISLKASEQQKRNVLGYFLSMQFNEYEFLEALKNPGENKNRFLEIIKIEKLTLADKLIREMVVYHDLQLTDHAHMTLTIHLSLAIQRVIQGEIIMMDQGLLDELKNDDKYAIALKIASTVEDVFNIEIPDAELGYITIHLKGARLSASMLGRIGEQTSVHTLACKRLITYVSQKLDVPFEKDPTILEGLLKHIEPAVYRLERDINLYNPLATKIATEYPRIFEATKEGLEKCFSHLQFPDAEIAYVVLYFGASQVLYDPIKEVKVVVICPSGLGSSKMLASRIKKEIEGVTEVTTLSLGELHLLESLQFDIVLSTVEVTKYSGRYLLVSPILSDLEIDRIQKEIKQYTRTTEEVLLKRLHEEGHPKELQFKAKEEFERVKNYTDLVLKLLNRFDIHHFNEAHHLDGVMSEILRILHMKKLITHINGVRVDLERREMLGGFGIPKTQLAFYHCRTAHVHEPVFSVFRMKKAVEVHAMDKTVVDVTSILVVLAPADASELQLELLSLISSAVIEEASAIELFTTGSKALIEERLSDVFYQKFKTIVKK